MVPQAFLAVDSLSFTKNHREMSIQCFANFQIFSERLNLDPLYVEAAAGQVARMTWTGLRSALPLRSPESRASEDYPPH